MPTTQLIYYGVDPDYSGTSVIYGMDPAYSRAMAAVYGTNPWYAQAHAAVYGADSVYASLMQSVYGDGPEYGGSSQATYGTDPLYLSADKITTVYGCGPEYDRRDGIVAIYGAGPLWQSNQELDYGPAHSGSGTPGEVVSVVDPASGEYIGKAVVGQDGTYTLHSYLSPDRRPTEVYITGQRVHPKSISLRFLRREVAHLATLEFANPDILSLARRDAPVVIKMWGRTVRLVVAESAATHLAHGEYSASITCQSWAVRLEMPAAKPVEGDLSGLMSELAKQLAGNIPIHWHTINDYIRPGQWIASGQSPLELLRQLATAVGATLHSTDTGELVVVPLYPRLVPHWPMAIPDAIVSTMDAVEVVDADALWQPGYNRCEVGDQAVSAATMRIEEDNTRSADWRKVVRVYQTPWQGDFALDHTDDPSFVRLEDLGVEERLIEDEEIQILRGQGRAQYPIYGFVGARYKARNLGTITTSEDGAIKTTEDGASLLYLSYRTRAHIWAVRDSRDGKVLLVAEREGVAL